MGDEGDDGLELGAPVAGAGCDRVKEGATGFYRWSGAWQT